jgi:hypothetical protein
MKNIIVVLDNDFELTNENKLLEEGWNLLPTIDFHVEIICLTTNLPAIEIRNDRKITRMFHPKLISNPFSNEATNSFYQGVDYITKKQFDVVHCIGELTWHIGSAAKKKNPSLLLVLEPTIKLVSLEKHQMELTAFHSILLKLRKWKARKRADLTILPNKSTEIITVESKSKTINLTNGINVYQDVYSTLL